VSEQLKKKIKQRVAELRILQALELAFIVSRPAYTWKGQLLEWGKDMPPGFRATMYEDAEVAVLLDASGVPVKLLFVDAYNQLREGAL
jgi:hypothetical protein